MRKETLRITNLSIQSEREGFLDNISLNLYEGEALGILGSPNSGKTLLLKVISGKYFFEEGVFFLNEERVDSLQLLREGRMAFVQHNSALVENLSVSDNIFYIKKHKHIQFLSKQKLYERLTKQHLEEFQISINPKAVIGTLSEVEKCIIEILKAYIWGAKIILVDSFSAIHPVGEYVYLNELMERMKKKGISFIVTDYQMQHLQICSDRILIMSKGKAIKAFVNKRRNQIDLTKIFGLISYENKKNGIERSKEVIMECLGIYVDIFKNLSMKIYKGEIVALIDFGREGVNHLYNLLQYPRYICEGKIMLLGKDYRSRAALNQVAFIDFASDDKVIPYMTLEDNLCLASYKRFLKGVFVDSTRQRFVKKDFLTWYKEYSINPDENCLRASEMDRIAIQIFRLKLQKPKVLFCMNPILQEDVQKGQLIRNSLSELARSGTAVMIMSDNVEQCNGLAERFLFIRNGYVSEEYKADELFSCDKYKN